MSDLLSKGYKRPNTGDPGSTWMPDEEDNITRLNDHTHNGTDSFLLNASLLTKDTSVAASGNWVDNGAGGYNQTITVPATISEINNHLLKVYITSTGAIINPGFARVDPTSYTLTVNDNTLDLTVVYV